MIITVTLNPALDKSIEVNNFSEGSINEILTERVDVAGKGINVSKVIKELKGDSLAITFFGGHTGKILLEFLDKNNIRHEAIKTSGETRVNIKMHDKVKNLVTDINAKGPFIYEDELNLFVKAINKNLKSGDIIIFSGSVPNGIDKDIYISLIKHAKEAGAITFLDADGEALRKGIEARPYFIRHNVQSLAKEFGIEISSKEQVIECCRKLLGDGIENIYVAMGKEGNIFVNRDKSYIIDQPDVRVKSRVGTGDSFVAGMAYSMANNYDTDKALRLAAACATATITMEGAKLGKLEDIKKYAELIKITTVNVE